MSTSSTSNHIEYIPHGIDSREVSEVWAKVTVKAQEQQEYIKALTRGVFGILQNICDRCFLRK